MKKRGIISLILILLMGILTFVLELNRKKKINSIKELSDKHLRMFKMMNRWVEIRQEGKSIGSFFVDNKYKTVIIYGMHYTGERLLQELKETSISVICGIDRNADHIYSDIDIINCEDSIPDSDVIVVTAISFFDEIETLLSQKVKCPIVSLEDIIYEI